MTSFTEMSLNDDLLKALSDLKFIKASPVQEKVIPIARAGSDLMACAETGSGKTAAYAIPILSRILEDDEANALVLAPTRELSQQIADVFRELGSHLDNFYVSTLVGGADMKKQVKSLKRNPRVVVASPGRLIDHLKRRTLVLNNTKMLCLDEGDRMLDMGFSPQLDIILTYLPSKRQTMLFTATLDKKVESLARNYLHKPQQVTIGGSAMPVSAIKQSVLQLTAKEKNDKILDELISRKGSIIVFSRTQRRTDQLAKHLKDFGHQVDIIHGGRSQGQRNRAIQGFKKGRSRILCATDIAARGIDVPQVEHVINFDLPLIEEDYVHRIGRTARNGAKGEALSFVTPSDHRSWQLLARKYKIQCPELKRLTKEEEYEVSLENKKKAGAKKFRPKKFSSKKKSSGNSKGKNFRGGKNSKKGSRFKSRSARS